MKDYDTVVMTWQGKDSSLPSVLLNSHTDVVPVYEVICFCIFIVYWNASRAIKSSFCFSLIKLVMFKDSELQAR